MLSTCLAYRRGGRRFFFPFLTWLSMRGRFFSGEWEPPGSLTMGQRTADRCHEGEGRPLTDLPGPPPSAPRDVIIPSGGRGAPTDECSRARHGAAAVACFHAKADRRQPF